jgi:hypothetical protein
MSSPFLFIYLCLLQVAKTARSQKLLADVSAEPHPTTRKSQKLLKMGNAAARQQGGGGGQCGSRAAAVARRRQRGSGGLLGSLAAARAAAAASRRQRGGGGGGGQRVGSATADGMAVAAATTAVLPPRQKFLISWHITIFAVHGFYGDIVFLCSYPMVGRANFLFFTFTRKVFVHVTKFFFILKHVTC